MSEFNEQLNTLAELFEDEEKPARDLSWQKECALKLIKYFKRNKIEAELVSVMTNGSVSTFILKSNEFNTIKQHLSDIEYELELDGRIRATEKLREYNRGIHFGIETYYRFLEGIYSRPFMRVEEQAYFVSLEIPSPKQKSIAFKAAFRMPFYFQTQAFNLAFPIGRKPEGGVEVGFLCELPHLLIGGNAGSGKTIFISTIIVGLICKNSPQDVRLLLIDPKQTELNDFENLPHSLTRKPIGEPRHAINALNYIVSEMGHRLKILADANETDINKFNASEEVKNGITKKLPYIVIVIDEFSDLILTNKNEVENLICSIAQNGKATGVHLVLSSQRVSSDVFTSKIKECIPARAVFRVSKNIESRIILNDVGADALSGAGDMLYLSESDNEPKRIKSCHISVKEIENLVKFFIDNYTDIDYAIEHTIFVD